MPIPVLVVFYIVAPAFIIYLCHKYSFLDKLGAALICYGVGMLIGNIGVLPQNPQAVQETFMIASIPLALPLLLFSLDLKKWSRLAGKTFLSFLFVITSVLVASFIAHMIYRSNLEGSWQVAGMLIGVYTGGSANLNAIGLALKVDEHVLVLTNTADMLMCTPYFLFMLSYGQRFFQKFMPAFCAAPAERSSKEAIDAACRDAEIEDINNYVGIWRRPILIPLLGATVVSLVIFAISAGAYTLVPKEYNMAALMLTITTLGILASFIRRIREIKMSFQLGQYIIMLFCIVVGSMADLRMVVHAAPAIMIFTFIVVYGSLTIHAILAIIFRIDADTFIITSIAGLFSPPFVPVVASALKNREVILSGLTTGIVGYVIGNYLGIFFAYFCKNLPF
ncbi:MAG: DUF819 family protein [Deltaproteobacteria bacterium]|nr:DUF819 family protein [Deltaproteobacteria bacterium]